MFRKNDKLIDVKENLKNINKTNIKKIIDNENDSLRDLNSTLEELIEELTDRNNWNDDISKTIKDDGLDTINSIYNKTTKRLDEITDLLNRRLDNLKDNIDKYDLNYNKYIELIDKEHEIISNKPVLDNSASNNQDIVFDYNNKLRTYFTDLDLLKIDIKNIEDEILFYEKESVKLFNDIKETMSKEKEIERIVIVSSELDSETKNFINL